MGLRARKLFGIGTAGLLVALLMLASVHAGSAGANACHRWGKTRAMHLTQRKASAAIRCYVNRARRRHGLRRVRLNDRLAEAADHHSRYMRRHRCFSHQCPGEPSLETRVRSARYPKRATTWGSGENIAADRRHHGTPRWIFREWMGSSAHRFQVLYGRYRDVGVGFVRGTPSNPHNHGGTYTLDLGYCIG